MPLIKFNVCMVAKEGHMASLVCAIRPVRFLLSPRIHYLITEFAQRTPLGKISGDQIRMGYATLSQISAILNEAGGTIRKRRELTNLSSEFYTRIPHCTGTSYNIGFETEGRKSSSEDIIFIYSQILFHDFNGRYACPAGN